MIAIITGRYGNPRGGVSALGSSIELATMTDGSVGRGVTGNAAGEGLGVGVLSGVGVAVGVGLECGEVSTDGEGVALLTRSGFGEPLSPGVFD